MSIFNAELAVAVRPSSFGGGWIGGTTLRGKEVLAEYYGTGPVPIKPLGVYLLEEGIAWQIIP